MRRGTANPVTTPGMSTAIAWPKADTPTPRSDGSTATTASASVATTTRTTPITGCCSCRTTTASPPAPASAPIPHQDMEIVTWVLSGRLEHKDSEGNHGELYPGLAQRMSAGTGIWHSEMNPSPTEAVHFIQMWVPPDTERIDPGYEQLDINAELDKGGLQPIASGRATTPPSRSASATRSCGAAAQAGRDRVGARRSPRPSVRRRWRRRARRCGRPGRGRRRSSRRCRLAEAHRRTRRRRGADLGDGMTGVVGDERDALTARREEIASRELHPREQRPASSARGVHHVALLSSDVQRTVDFYQGLLEFPLTEMFENRDYEGSTHFFFDIGNGNALAFFDLPGLDLGPYAEVLGGCTISRSPSSRSGGRISRPSSTTPASSTRTSTARRSTSATPMAPASSSSAIRSARCTASPSSSLRTCSSCRSPTSRRCST